MLKGFVSEEDYPKLLEILNKANCRMLGDVSVLQIWGAPASGKSTLIEVIRRLSGGDNVRIVGQTADIRRSQPEPNLKPFQKTVACCHDAETRDIAPVLTKIHRLINLRDPVEVWVFRRGIEFVQFTATLVVGTSEPYALTQREKDWRHPMYLHLPNVFNGAAPYDDVVQQCLSEFYELSGLA